MANETLKAIICRVGKEEYALDVAHVLSIERVQTIRSLPHTEAFMAGIMQLRGTIIPVMDLGTWLGLEKAADADLEQQRIIVTEANGTRLGLIVDAATDVLDIDVEGLQAVEMQRGGHEVNQVADVDGRLILIFDVPQVLQQLKQQEAKEDVVVG